MGLRRLLAAVLLVLAAAGSVQGRLAVPVAYNGTRHVRLGYISTRSFFGSPTLGGFQSELALRAALQFLEAQSNHSISFEVVYGEASETASENSTVRCRRVAQALVDAQVDAVVGPPASSCAIPSAAVFASAGVVQISHSATAEALSNKALYPTFFRIPPSDNNQGAALGSFCVRCSWSKLGIISTTDAYASGLKRSFAQYVTAAGIEIVNGIEFQQGLSPAQITSLVSTFKENRTTINLIIAAKDDAVNILRSAIQLGMTGGDYVWLASDSLTTNTALTRDILNFFEGLLGLAPLAVSGALNKEFHAFPDRYQYSQYAKDAGIPSFNQRLFDALNVVRHAVQSSSDWPVDDLAERRAAILRQGRMMNSTENSIPGASRIEIYFDEFQNGPAAYEVINIVTGRFTKIGTLIGSDLDLLTNVTWPLIVNGTNARGFGNCPSRLIAELPPAPPPPAPPPPTSTTTQTSSTTRLPDGLIVVVVVLCALLVCAIMVVVVLARRRRRVIRPHNFGPQLAALNLKTESKPPREIMRRFVKVEGKLGGGFYGIVHRGVLDEQRIGGRPAYPVAIKVCRENATSRDRESLLDEAATMAQFASHPNIVTLIGVVSAGEPLMLVMELCGRGNLAEYLRASFNRLDLSLASKLRMALDVAEGMMFISEAGAVHRDLAARNIFMTENGICKIGDFGLARNLQYYSASGDNVAIKWAAPESITDGMFSTHTDVWSYGIFVVELCLNGQAPYPNMSNEAVRVAITAGYRHPPTESMPDALYEFLLSCWEEDPTQRPSFADIRDEISALHKSLQAQRLNLSVSRKKNKRERELGALVDSSTASGPNSGAIASELLSGVATPTQPDSGFGVKQDNAHVHYTDSSNLTHRSSGESIEVAEPKSKLGTEVQAAEAMASGGDSRNAKSSLNGNGVVFAKTTAGMNGKLPLMDFTQAPNRLATPTSPTDSMSRESSLV